MQGTGGVSLFVLQIAVAHGCRVIVTSSNGEKLLRAQELAGPCWLGGINYKEPNPDPDPNPNPKRNPSPNPNYKEEPRWGKAAKRMALDPEGKNHGVHHVVEVCAGVRITNLGLLSDVELDVGLGLGLGFV